MNSALRFLGIVSYVAVLAAAALCASITAYGWGQVTALLRDHPLFHALLTASVLLVLHAEERRKARKGRAAKFRAPERGDALRALRSTLLGLVPIAAAGVLLATFLGSHASPDWRALVLVSLAWTLANPTSVFFAAMFGFRPLIPGNDAPATA